MSHTAPARASNEWVVESGKATGLWGAGMFVAALCSKLFGLHPAVATLAQRTGDFLTALILVGPQVNATVLRSQSALGVLCGLVTGLITTGASTYYNRALVKLAEGACVPACRRAHFRACPSASCLLTGRAIPIVCAGCRWGSGRSNGIDVALSGDHDLVISSLPL